MNDTLERLWHRILFVVARGRLTLLDDSGKVQLAQVQLSADEVKDGTPRLAEYGFQSSPPPGSDAILLFIAGERTNGVVIACGNQTYRMRGLASGEVAISDNRGQSVYLSAAGITINGGGLPTKITNSPNLLIDVPAVRMTGTLEVVGNIQGDANITATGNVGDLAGASTMAGMRSIYDSHHHGTSAGPTPLM